MSRFKKGDRVVCNSGPGWVNVKGIVTDPDGHYVYFRPDKGQGKDSYDTALGAAMYESSFELETPAPVSDEDLANEYRALYLKQREVVKELRSRGFKRQWRAPTRNFHEWKDAITAVVPDEVRFIKTVSETVMVPKIKTTLVEI